MENNKKKRGNTFRKNEKVILLLLILAIALDLVISVISIIAIERQTTGYIRTLLDAQSTQIDVELSRINTELTRILMENSDLQRSAISYDTLTSIGARIKLRDKLSYAFSSYSSDYTFFYLLRNDENLLQYNASNSHNRDLEKNMVTIMRASETAGAQKSIKWDIVKIKNQNYAIKMIQYNNCWIGCYIRAEKLFSATERQYQNIEWYPALITTTGHIVKGDSWPEKVPLVFEQMEQGKTYSTGVIRRWSAVISDKNYNTNFSLAIMAQGYGDFYMIVILQGALIFTALTIVGVAVVITVYTRYKITQPIINFTKGLKLHSDGKNDPPLKSSDIEELEELNEQFRNLMNEVKRLKIDIYEQELDKQRIQMDYMQLQIKPHFFLNNLTIIHSMAKKNQVSEIEQISLSTVKYLRYIFKSNMSYTLIKDELDHISNLFAIMKIRRGENMESDIFQDEKTLQCVIPPLVIQTFVENSFKYAPLTDRGLEISVSVTKEMHDNEGKQTPYISVFITDNGPGFPQEYINLWEQGKNLIQVDGEKVGITNANKRLSLLYGKQANVKLYNGTQGGAIVKIELPFKEETKKYREEGFYEYIVGG